MGTNPGMEGHHHRQPHSFTPTEGILEGTLVPVRQGPEKSGAEWRWGGPFRREQYAVFVERPVASCLVLMAGPGQCRFAPAECMSRLGKPAGIHPDAIPQTTCRVGLGLRRRRENMVPRLARVPRYREMDDGDSSRSRPGDNRSQ